MKEKIFIVDDEKDIVEVLIEGLSARLPHYIIDFSYDGEAALKKMLETK